MIEVQILIPVADNAGQPFASAMHEAFEREMVALFGGWQRQPGTVRGEWIDGGTVYADELLTYAVAVPGMIASADPIRRMVAFAKAHYGQLAVYVRYAGLSEIL